MTPEWLEVTRLVLFIIGLCIIPALLILGAVLAYKDFINQKDGEF